MKSLTKAIAIAAAMFATVATAAVLPRVGNGTSPNEWTRNIDGVLSAAKSTNLPILLVMINDSSTGEGCPHCMKFVNNTLNTANFAGVVARQKFYMVLLNNYGNFTGTYETDYGCVSSEIFNKYFFMYKAHDTGYPQVAVIRPDGTRYTGWSYSTSPITTSGTTVYRYIEQAIAELAPATVSNTEISLSAQSGNVVTVNADPTSPAMAPGVWTGAVTRSGGSGKTGTVSISISGGSYSYALSDTTLAWDANDGTKTFTVTGPSPLDGGIVSDTITVGISASGFDGSSIAYGTTSQTVVFKDSRVKSTLAEFAASNAGMGGLASAAGVWFVPSQDDGNVLETVAADVARLTFTAVSGGILTVEAGASAEGMIAASDKLGSVDLVGGEPVRFGVAAGDVVTFAATPTPGTANAKIGFAKFEFSPLTVSLASPAANAQIAYDSLAADKSLANLAWSASLPGCTFGLTCNGVSADMGTATSGNAVDLGFVPLSPETRTYAWSVNASYTEDGLRGTAAGAASSSFTVAALPVYGSVPSSVVAYKSVGAQIDMSVDSAGSGGVTYSASGLPSGMSIDPATGVISGMSKKIKRSTVTVVAANAYGSATATFTLSVEKFPKEFTKPKYALFFFGGDDSVLASAKLSVTSGGKWTAAVSEGGRSKNYKGSIASREDGSISIMSSSLDLAYDSGSGIWSGSDAYGRRVFGGPRAKIGAPWKGTWNMGFASSASAGAGGWAIANVKASGDVTFSGSIFNKSRISGSCYSAEFPGWFVAANLPRWAGHGNVRFCHTAAKTGLNIGCALFSDGTLGAGVSLGSQVFDLVEGSFWSKSVIPQLNGATMRTTGGGNIEIPVVASGTKISAGDNGYRARVSCVARSGKTTVSYRLDGGARKATGVIFSVGGTAKAFGAGTSGDERFVFTIE